MKRYFKGTGVRKQIISRPPKAQNGRCPRSQVRLVEGTWHLLAYWAACLPALLCWPRGLVSVRAHTKAGRGGLCAPLGLFML